MNNPIHVKPKLFDKFKTNRNFVRLFSYEKTGKNQNCLPNWSKIEKVLAQSKNYFYNPINFKNHFGDSLKTIIIQYCPAGRTLSDFQLLNKPELQPFLEKALPQILNHAINLPYLLHGSIPSLKQGENKTIFITRELAASLLANAFLCTFPKPGKDFPDLNFFTLFNNSDDTSKIEKLKCILNYFQMLSNRPPTFFQQIISFERKHIEKKVNWDKSNLPLISLRFEKHVKIEEADGMLQVDFANKKIGGGVLNNGCVMEEIRFVISPELLISRLFTQSLGDNEILKVTGTLIFSKYTGYSKTFRFSHSVNNSSERTDGYGRTFTQVVAMDALHWKKTEAGKQFQRYNIDRELHKAFVGFARGNRNSAVATGEWGCGAFNGNSELKFLIQVMAASQAQREYLQYHTNKDMKRFKEALKIFQERKVTVGDLYEKVIKFNDRKDKNVKSVLDYVKTKFTKISFLPNFLK